MERPAISIDPAETALLVIDMQNDFCEPGGYYENVGVGIERVAGVIPNIARLLEAARATGVLVLFTAIEFPPLAAGVPSDIPEVHRVLPAHFKALTPRLVMGTWGAKISDQLAPLEHELVLSKPGYSAFYQTRLESLLRRRGIKNLLLTGTAAYGCVLGTAYDAFVRDFDLIIVGDAVASSHPDLERAAMQIMASIHGPVVTAHEVMTMLSVSGTPIAAASVAD